MHGAAARMGREHKERAWLAYHTAYLPLQKKAVKLEDLSGATKAKPRKKTWRNSWRRGSLRRNAAIGGDMASSVIGALRSTRP